MAERRGFSLGFGQRVESAAAYGVAHQPRVGVQGCRWGAAPLHPTCNVGVQGCKPIGLHPVHPCTRIRARVRALAAAFPALTRGHSTVPDGPHDK